MKYICLIYEDESIMPSRSEDEQNAIMGDYFAFTNEVQEAGKHLGDGALPDSALNSIHFFKAYSMV